MGRPIVKTQNEERKNLFIDVRNFERNYYMWAMLLCLISFQFSGAGAIFLYLYNAKYIYLLFFFTP